MYQKDYILRMIAMLIKFLGEVLGLIKKGELKEAADKLEEGYNTFLREDASFFHNIPADKLTQKLIQEHNYTNGHLEILAELFNAEAGLRLARDDKHGSLEFSEKSLILFEFVDKEYKTFSEERIRKMEDIRMRIKELSSTIK
ncbi:MAG: hypothetical protein MUO72_03405 [Bacteroidales bacterium]|nr:hypothetical protein [Bacteroidales bacterium]